MTVYVDPLMPSKQYRESANKRWNWEKNCHMTADTVEELHTFAKRLGLKRDYFQGHHLNPLFWHYDLNESRRKVAVEVLHAQEITWDQWCERVGMPKRPAAIAQIPPHPEKCDCRTPIWRWLDGTQWPILKDSQQWVCLNCPLHDAIHLNRDSDEQQRLLALIDATRPEKASTS